MPKGERSFGTSHSSEIDKDEAGAGINAVPLVRSDAWFVRLLGTRPQCVAHVAYCHVDRGATCARPQVSHRFACTAALKNLLLRWHRAFSEQKRQEKNGSHKRIPLIMILAAVAHDRLSRSFLCPIAQAGPWNIQLLADLRESNIREAVFFRNHNHRFRPNLFLEPFAIVSTGKHVCLSSGVNPSLFSLCAKHHGLLKKAYSELPS